MTGRVERGYVFDLSSMPVSRIKSVSLDGRLVHVHIGEAWFVCPPRRRVTMAFRPLAPKRCINRIPIHHSPPLAEFVAPSNDERKRGAN